MKKNIISILGILLMGSLLYVSSAMSDDTPTSSIDNNTVVTDTPEGALVTESLESLQGAVEPPMEPEGIPESEIQFREEIPASGTMETNENAVPESGTLMN